MDNERLKILGCPICSIAFCSATIEQTVVDTQKDLLLLQDSQVVHQRMKQATECYDTRPSSSYLFRAMSPSFMDQYTKLLDKAFVDFNSHILCFEQDYQDCQYKE